ncbi:hypothetical protein V1264_023851 [Littorina saxatilis]|uniref:Uncharacterized protein n=2 Tax=Littorina saxatilis TaxID=31220 RepID=A0AAN9GAI3_9CAEN
MADAQTDEKADETQKGSSAKQASQCAPEKSLNASASGDNNALDNLFLRFEAFNFIEDQQFQAGLSKITVRPDLNTGEDLLKIKAFYYTKNVEPFDLRAYMSWSGKQATSSSQDSRASKDLIRTSKSSTAPLHSASLLDSHLPKTVQSDGSSQGDLGLKKEESTVHETAESDATVLIQVEEAENSYNSRRSAVSDQNEELSFADIVELVQSGKPIPGLAQVEVVPTNEAPTPSLIPRTKKPWEE